MSERFEEWMDTLDLADVPFGGAPTTPGAVSFLRGLFDQAGGPVPEAAVASAWGQKERELAAQAVTLVAADIHRTTDLDPRIEVRALDDGMTAVVYNGGYTAPVLSSIRDPEATCDVADYLRDCVAENLWTPWPICADHGTVPDPRPLGDASVWRCRIGAHVVSAIGALPAGR